MIKNNRDDDLDGDLYVVQRSFLFVNAILLHDEKKVAAARQLHTLVGATTL
jgi:hypothetical protein